MESVLFISRKCRYSLQIIEDFPNLPPSISLIDVHDPRALRYLTAYNIQAVPTLLVVEPRSGKYSLVTNRQEVARVIMALAPQARQTQEILQPKKLAPAAPKKPDQYKTREGVDSGGPFPQDDNKGGLCGFDGNCSSELQDMGESYQAPFASQNSMERQLMASASPDQRPQSQFQPPMPPQRPLLAATQSGNAPQTKAGSSISDDEMNRKLEELARAREDYDRNLESKNRQMNTLSQAMRN